MSQFLLLFGQAGHQSGPGSLTEYKLCRLSEFFSKQKKLRVNVGKSNVTRYSKYVIGG